MLKKEARVTANAHLGSTLMAEGIRWTRQELLVAMNVCEKLPFGQLDQSNPVIRDVARKLNRTPGSVAMKLCNLASLDPALAARGRKGLTGASTLDRDVWNEFRNNSEAMAAASEEAFRKLFTTNENDDVDLVKGLGVRIHRTREVRVPLGPTEKKAAVTVRRGQQFFRQMILNAFDNRCCVTGIAVRELLVASHIKPWGGFPKSRLDIQNGLCLSKLHDAAFDSGLISFDDDCCMLLSRELESHLPQPSIDQNFLAYSGKPLISAPESLGPKKEYLSYHRRQIFRV